MAGRLEGKSAVILGASQRGGCGWVAAQVLAAEGAKIFVAARRLEKVEELAAEMGGTAMRCDAGSEADVKAYVDAARAYLRAMTSNAADEARASGGISRDTKVSLQLAACFMTEMSAKAVDLLWESAGGSAIWTKHRFESHFRDVHVITQHTQVSSARYASVGKVLVGLTSDSFVLEN